MGPKKGPYIFWSPETSKRTKAESKKKKRKKKTAELVAIQKMVMQYYCLNAINAAMRCFEIT